MSHAHETPLQTALHLARRGWSVFPIHSIVAGRCTCGRDACNGNRQGKHPRTKAGFLDASKDPARVTAWWTKWPASNVGIATGLASGFDVLDVDPRHDGDETLTELIRRHGELPETVQVKTGGGGGHYFFRHDPRARTSAIAPGLEVKANGGYVVGVGSVHFSGGTYEWEGSGHPNEVEIAEWPAWLLETIDGGKRPPVPPNEIRRTTDAVFEGERNAVLTSLAGTMRAIGFDPSDIEPALQGLNLRCCNPPLERNEVLGIARGMGRYRVGTLGGRDAFVPPGYENQLAAILDVMRFATTLSAAEFSVLLFHVERQIAYGKASDDVSISQLINGVYSKKNGWLRKGCGLKKTAALAANKSLVARGFLKKESQIAPDGAYAPTRFSLDWQTFGTYLDEVRTQPAPTLVREAHNPLVRHVNIQNPSITHREVRSGGRRRVLVHRRHHKRRDVRADRKFRKHRLRLRCTRLMRINGLCKKEWKWQKEHGSR